MKRRALLWADWVGVTSLAAASDGQLLFRFARLGEQQAFTVLVQRHGPLVWGLCRRLLGSHQDAEDAFQATFLILSRKAASLRQPDALVNWLYGVAYRTALQLRSRRRVALPLESVDEPARAGDDQAAWRECGSLIDQAIRQLPAPLRLVFLLSQAEELTTLAVAKRLGIPEGTVVSRLHRARQRLQQSLARQGITSAAGAVAFGWSLALPENVAASALPSILAATPSLVVAGLAQGVITTMFWIKWTTVAVVTASLGLVGAGTATLLAQGNSEIVQASVPVVTQPPRGEEKDRRIKELQVGLEEAKQRENQLKDELELLKKQNAEVKRFLEQQMLGLKATGNQEARRQAQLEEEKRRDLALRQQAEQQAERLELQKKAQAELSQRLDKLYHQFDLMEQQAKSVAVQQREYDRRMIILDGVQKELRDAKSRLDEANPVVKSLMATRDKEQSELRKVQDTMIQNQVHPAQKSRLQSQISLYEKLLLELEEKLLRKQYRLDEK